MQLITAMKSGDKKTGPMAVTYRAGNGNMLGTCPSSCAMMPEHATGTSTVDREYLGALLGAVPLDGSAFTYTHFSPRHWVATWRARVKTGKPTTTINASADTEKQAAAWARRGIPTVVAIPGGIEVRKSWKAFGATFVRCPAEYSGVSCNGGKTSKGETAACGGGRPLCAQPERGYVVAFHAHGAARNLVGTEKLGGCYGSGGNVRIHWDRLASKPAEDCSAKVKAFAASLEPTSIIRHHVVGDIGISK